MNVEKIRKQTIAILIIVLALVIGTGIWFGKTSGLAGHLYCKISSSDTRC